MSYEEMVLDSERNRYWSEQLRKEMSSMSFLEAVTDIPRITAEDIRALKGRDNWRIDFIKPSHQHFKSTMSYGNTNGLIGEPVKELAPLREQHTSLQFYGDCLRRNEETLATAKQLAELLNTGRPAIDFTRIDLVVETGAGRRDVLRVSVGNNTKSLPQVVEATKWFLEELRKATLSEVVATAEATADAASQLVKFSTEQNG